MEQLREINDRFVEIMKKESGVLGAWEFGSAMHGTKDEYSDIDIVFLLDADNYYRIDAGVEEMLESVCDRIVIFWAEDFNNDAMKNYDCILKKDGKLFQYDVFLLNHEHIDDFMCQLHYMDLKKEDVLFEMDNVVSNLIEKAPKGQVWSDNMMRLIQTYWLHIDMTIKYFLRKDYFKLEGILRILMDTHTSLLLTAYDRITWGGTANKLHFLTEEKQNHLKKYYCSEDFDEVRENLLRSMCWFEEDIAEMGSAEMILYSQEMGKEIKKAWLDSLEK